MEKMVLLHCTQGSKAATVLCPRCGRISKQILQSAYNRKYDGKFANDHICVVCETAYQYCNPAQAEDWDTAYQRYTANPSAYNSFVKDNFANQSAHKTNTPISSWQDLFTRSILKRGIAYANADLVKDIVKTESSFAGTVVGSIPYQIKIELAENSIISMQCTCPYAAQGENCKHMAALLSKITSQRSLPAAENSFSTDETTEQSNAQASVVSTLRSVIDTKTASPEIPANSPVRLSQEAQSMQSPQAPDVLTNENTALLDRKISRWKKELLDTSKRNKMINYRETSRTTLKILEPGAEELFNKLAFSDKALTFQKPITKDTDFRTYSVLALMETLSYTLPVHFGDIKASGTILEREKTLKHLRAKTKLAKEEQGANILYLSFGFILWREKDKPNASWLKAPLLMMPVSLGLKALNAPYTLSRYDDEIEVNPTLDYLFNAEYGIDLPTFKLENKESFNNYLNTIEEIVDRRGWKLVREVSLGLLSFLKISMYHDLNNENNLQRIKEQPVLRAMGGDYSALKPLPDHIEHFDFDKIDPKDWYQVVNADSSQQEAVLLSKLGMSFVMQGPPGTGKSQTITNIIAEALADGKKVLFVSEKAAALQVVLKRLTETGLADFCLSLHNYKANKKEIIDNIGANLSLPKENVKRSAMTDLTELFSNREKLHAYAHELHTTIEPFGKSIYAAFGRFTQLNEASEVHFSVANIAEISEEQFLRMLNHVEQLERILNTTEEPLRNNPWYLTTLPSSGQAVKTQILNQTIDLQKHLRSAEEIISTSNRLCNLHLPNSWSGLHQWSSDLKQILALPLFPHTWLASDTDELLHRAQQEYKAQQEYQGNLRKFKETFTEKLHTAYEHSIALDTHTHNILSVWTRSALELDADTLCQQFGTDFARIYANNSIDGTIKKKVKTSYEVLTNMQRILQSYQHTKTLLDITLPETISSLRIASQIVSLLSTAPYMEEPWFDLRKNAEIDQLLDEALTKDRIVRTKTEALLQQWEPGILKIDADGMLARFKTEYTGLFHKLKGNYKEDMQSMKLLAKRIGAQITEEDAVAVLQAVRELRAEQTWFIENSNRFSTLLGQQYLGTNTDWAKLKYGVSSALRIAKLFPYSNIPQAVICAIQASIENTQKSAELRQLADELAMPKIEVCRAELLALEYIDGFTDDTDLSSLMPQIEDFIRSCAAQAEHLSSICTHYKNLADKSALTYQDVSSLAENLIAIKNEKQWFSEHEDEYVALIGSAYRAEQTPWQALLDNLPIDQAAMVQQWQSDMEDRAGELNRVFGYRYEGLSTDWEIVIQDIQHVARFTEQFARTPFVEDTFVQAICNDGTVRSELQKLLEKSQTLLEQTEPMLLAFTSLFEDGSTYLNWSLSDVSDKYALCMERFDLLDRWIDYSQAKSACDSLGLSTFTSALSSADAPIHDIKDAFEKGFYQQWLAEVLSTAPAVQGFRKESHKWTLKNFVSLDEGQFSIASSRIRQKLIKSFPSPYGVHDSEMRILLHEMEKRRMIMPLRKLFRSIPKLLLQLKPCLMMSPLSVAYFLETGAYHFDMVIFDEASQIFPEDAIGAILRADQVIIAGDTKQLPPTNFFATSTNNGNELYGDSEDEEMEDEVYDSILEETAHILPNRTLRWHYRSKHEHLIAFSNAEIYKNELVTFPNCTDGEADTGVEFVYVEDGYYEATPKNHNIGEAKRCVALIKEHIDKHKDRSLGVIAFSEKQQQAILTQVQRFREENPQYEEFFAEGKEDEFFVKNLENVQGDERDTIIFSVCYAKTKEQKAAGRPMSMRFGPLGTKGGERRLNVAITRAKRNIKIVSSILPSDFNLASTESEGIKMLHDYIAFAINGGATLPSARVSQTPDEFKSAIATFLRENGYDLVENLGFSDYKIDIAIVHPERAKEYVAGIECDGLSYASARTVRDRDRLRSSVLTSMGWQLYRVWSAEWYKNSDIEKTKLLTFVDNAIKKSDEQYLKSEAYRKEAEAQRRREELRVQAAKEQEEKKRQLEAAKQSAPQPSTKKDKLAAPHDRSALYAKQANALKEAKEQAKNALCEKYAWVKDGVKVSHTAFGIGTIVGEPDSYIAVRFGAQTNRFLFPDCFERGYLSRFSDNQTAATPSEKSQSQTKQAAASIHTELVSSGFKCIDNRSTSNILWVLYDCGKASEFDEIIRRHRLPYRFEARGSLATENKAAWRIMVQ